MTDQGLQDGVYAVVGKLDPVANIADAQLYGFDKSFMSLAACWKWPETGASACNSSTKRRAAF
jgi:hypothetical protein